MPALAFEAMPADIDERGIQAAARNLSGPREIARCCWRARRRGWSRRGMPDGYVVGADQTLALGERLFNKPAGRAQAAEQLRALAGKTHELHSAIAVAQDGKIVFETCRSRG